MKHLTLLVWLTQLGFSIAFPLAGFVFLAVWLRNSLGWGNWVLWAGILLGLNSAVGGFRQSMKAMERMAKDKNEQSPPPVSFNEHT